MARRNGLEACGLLLIRAGALPNSQSPIIAEGGAVIGTICHLPCRTNRSILLISEKFAALHAQGVLFTEHPKSHQARDKSSQHPNFAMENISRIGCFIRETSYACSAAIIWIVRSALITSSL